MAEEGFGFLGPATLDRFREENASVLEGPTPEELLASRATAGAGLDLGSDNGRFDLSDLGAVGRGIGSALSLPRDILRDVTAHIFTGRSAAERDQEIAARRKLQLDAERAALRQANISATIQSLQYVSPLANSVASISDPEKRAQVQAQARAQIVSDFGDLGELGGGLFDAMVERQAISRQRMEDMLPSLMKSRTFRASLLANNGDLSDLKPEQVQTIVTESARETARENLKTLRTQVRDINQAYKRRFPSEAESEEKSDTGLSVSEFTARAQAVEDEVQFLQDPANKAMLNDAMEFYPTGLDLQPDAAVEAAQGKLMVERVRQREGLSAPGSVTVNVGGLKGAKEGTFQSVLAETGDARLAAAAVQGDAYREPILGEWVFGSDVDRRKSEGRKAFISAIGDLRAAANDVATTHADTNVQTEIENRIARAISSGDPLIERYEQARNSAALNLQVATTGAQASEKELERLIQQFPSVRAVAKGGKVTETADRLFTGLEKKIINEHVASFPVEDQERIAAAISRKPAQVSEQPTQEELNDAALRAAESVLGNNATMDQLEAAARRILESAGK